MVPGREFRDIRRWSRRSSRRPRDGRRATVPGRRRRRRATERRKRLKRSLHAPVPIVRAVARVVPIVRIVRIVRAVSIRRRRRRRRRRMMAIPRTRSPARSMMLLMLLPVRRRLRVIIRRRRRASRTIVPRRGTGLDALVSLARTRARRVLRASPSRALGCFFRARARRSTAVTRDGVVVRAYEGAVVPRVVVTERGGVKGGRHGASVWRRGTRAKLKLRDDGGCE